jgi:alkylation response protein AidB-like acyl-CoA dehydrogenase
MAPVNQHIGELEERMAPILPIVARHAEWTDEHRRPHPEVFAALASAGLLRLIAPAHYGGLGGGSEEFLAVVEAIARIDGSAAWTAMTVNEEVGIASAYLPAESMTALLTGHPDVIIAGSGVALGQARRVDGGWTINGRWKFVSGVPVADRVVLASRVVAGGRDDPGADAPRRTQRVCFTLTPVSEVVIEDTWHTAGLRGTGSNDVVLSDVFVADAWAGVFGPHDLPVPRTPYYCLPSGLRFPFPKVGVAVGVARSAMIAFDQLARTKRPSFLPELLAERPNAQAAVARAEALVGSGRAWVSSLLAELWEVAGNFEPITPELHARSRLAASYAVDSARLAVEGLASAAGTTASQLDGPWPRLLADVRSVGQHFMVGPQQMDTAGRVLLGQIPVTRCSDQTFPDLCAPTDVAPAARGSDGTGSPPAEAAGLDPDRGRVPVVGVDHGGRWQCQEPVLDRVEDQVKAAERAAGGTRPTVEQGVAAEQDPFGRQVETASTR